MADIVMDRTRALPLAKIVYQGPIREAFRHLPGKKDLFDREVPSKVKISTRGGIFPIAVGPNMSGGFFADGGQLPHEGAGEYVDAQFSFTSYAAAIRLTGEQIDVLDREGPAAFANIVQVEIERAVKDLNALFNRFINFDDKGALATVSANSDGSTTIATANGDKAFYLNKGMVVSFVDPTTGTYRTPKNVHIDAVASDLSSITVDQSVASGAVQAGDVIVQRESFGLGLHGIDYHANAATWLGLDRVNDHPNLKGISVNAGGSDISAELLEQTLGQLWQLGASPEDGVIACWGPDQESRYKSAIYPLIRFQPGGEGNFNVTPAHGPIDFRLDRDTPIGTIQFFRPKNFFWVVIKELEWGTPDNQTFHQLWESQGSGALSVPVDAYYAPLIWRGQLVTDFPHHIAVISNLSYDSVFRSRSYSNF